MLYLVEYPENENFNSVLDTAWFAIGIRLLIDMRWHQGVAANQLTEVARENKCKIM